MTKFPLYLSFTVQYNYTKNGRFTPILSITIVLITVCVCSFLILKISQLESQVCRKHSSISLDFINVLYFFFLVGYGILKDFSYLFDAKFPPVENATVDVMTIDQ